MLGIQLRQIYGERNIFYLSAVVAMKMAVRFGHRIKTHLSRTRVKTANDSLGGHEFKVAVHGSKADSRELLLDP